MKKYIAGTFLLLFLHQPSFAQIDQYRDEIRSLLNTEEENGFTGTVLVVQEGELLINEGYGYTAKDRNHKVVPTTLFNIASITKSFTAIAALQLIEQGRLGLDDRLSKFFASVPEDKKDISIHHLLSHTSGLPQNYVCMRMGIRGPCMIEIFKETLLETPGEAFRYSNNNYLVLAAVIEIVSQSSWEGFLTEYILNQAGLTHTRFWGTIDDRDASKVAQKINKLSKKTRERNWDFLGASGIYTTAPDLYKWFEALQSGILISEPYRDMLFTPKIRSKSGIGVGYGWFLTMSEDGAPERWTRGSESFGHNAVLRWFPDQDVIVIVCTNTGERNGKSLTDNRRISDHIIKIIL